jgi:hypothetical protein
LITYDELPGYLKVEELLIQEDKKRNDIIMDDLISEIEYTTLCDDGFESSSFSLDVEKLRKWNQNIFRE